MKITYTLNGIEHTIDLPESAIREIYYTYRAHLEEEDVDSYIEDIESGVEEAPEGVTAEDLRARKADFIGYFHDHRENMDEYGLIIRPALDEAIEDIAFDITYDRR